MDLNELDSTFSAMGDSLPLDRANPPAPANPIEATFQAAKDQEKVDLQQSMFVASKENPDTYAEAYKIAKESNLPTNFVARNLDSFKQAKVKQGTDLDSLVEAHPELSRWLANPDNAAVAQDDIENLKNIEDTVKAHSALSDMYSALASGMGSANASIARIPELLYNTAALPQNLAVNAGLLPGSMRVRSTDILPTNPVAEYFETGAKELAPPEMGVSITESIGKGNYSLAGRAMALQFVANAPQQAALIASALSGAPQAGLMMAGTTSAATSSAENIKAGVDPAVGTLNALTKGTIEAGFESLGTFGILHHWEGKIAKEYGKAASKEVIKDFAKTMAYSFAGEANEEFMTSVAQDFTDYVTGVNPDALTGIGTRALDAGLVGGFSGGLMTGPSAIAAGKMRAKQSRDAAMARDFYQNLGKSIESTKLKDRLPDGMRGLVDTVAQGTPVQDVFIPVNAMESYFQGEKISPAAAAQELGISQEYNDAKETGQDIRVPLSTLTGKLIGTPHYNGLANDIKFSPEAKTVNETHAEAKEVAANLAAEQAKVEAEQQRIAEDEKAKVDAESHKLVAEEIAKQLEATGLFQPNEVKQYATLYAERYNARAENRGLGERAYDLFKGENLSITAPGQFEEATEPSAAQNQGGIIGGIKSLLQSAKEKVNGKKAVIEMPLDMSKEARMQRAQEMGFDTTRELMHGTRGEFDSFDLEKAKPGTRGRGIYLTDQPEMSGPYSRNGKLLKVFIKDADKIAPFDRKLSADELNKVKSSIEPEVLQFLESNYHLDEGQTVGNLFRVLGVVEKDLNKPNGAPALARAMGISGIEVPGREHVIFDPANIRSVDAAFDPSKAESPNILFQGDAASPRGRIQFGKGKSIIEIFDGKDLSTVLHESGHLWLNELVDDATVTGGNPNNAKRLDTILDWMGLGVRASDGAEAVKAAIKVDHHEQFARGFEAYLREGKAPSKELRSVFTRFKAWLTTLYPNVKQLNVSLNDEVRRVFDSMLVADSEAKNAEQELNFNPLFADPVGAGMNELTAGRYAKAFAEAHEATMDKLQQRLMDDLNRERKSWWKEESSKFQAQVEAEVKTDQRYQALEILQKGVTEGGVEVKLDREAIVREYGREFLKRLPRPVVYAKEGGMTHHVVAEMLGFESGDAMLTTLANLQKPKDYIKQETERRMREHYPELADESNIQDVAKSMAMNTDRSKVVAMELEHLAQNNLPILKDAIRRVAKRPPTLAVVRAKAEGMVGRQAVGQVRPKAYLAAAAKAAKEAGVLLAKGDVDGAFDAKSRELLNIELHRAAEAATAQVDKALDNFKKLRRSDEDLAKSRDMDLINAGRAILSRFGLSPKLEKSAEDYLNPIKHYNPEMYQNVLGLVQGASQNAMPYKEMTFEDFQALSDMHDAIWDLSKSSREIEVDGKKMDRNDAIQEINDRLAELTPAHKSTPGLNQSITDSEKRVMGLKSIGNMFRRVGSWARAMDGDNINGSFTRIFVRPISDATTNYRIARDEKLTQLEKVFQGYKIENPEAKIPAPNLGYTFTKPELLMALLHSGNESNLKKLLLGRGWGSINQEGKLDTSKWDAFRAKAFQDGTITKADMDLVQGIWDLNESMKPEAQKAHKKMYGYYFNEITANSVSTPFGEYKGGYMPAVSDPNLSVDADIRAGQSIEESPAQMFPTTGRGFTKSRMENYQTPLSLDFGKVKSHIDKVLKFTYIEPAVKDAAALVNNRELRGTLNNYDMGVANELLIPYLKRAATQTSATPGWNKTIDRAANAFKRASSMQFMAMNVVNSIQNLTGVFPSMTFASPTYLAGSFKNYILDPEGMAEQVAEASPYMRQRMSEVASRVNKSVDDVILNPSKFEKAKDAAINISYAMDKMTNGMVEVSVWNAVYNEQIAKEASHDDALHRADQAVEQALMGGNPENLSAYEAGTPVGKFFTMFSGFFNTQANLAVSEAQIANQEGLTGKGAGRAGKAYLNVVALPAIVSAIIARVMAGEGLDADDDGEYFDDIVDVFFTSQVKYLMAMIPFGGVVQSAVNQYNDKPYDDKINLSPAISNLEKAFHAPVSIYQAMNGNGQDAKAIREGMTAMGLATGLPLAPVAKPLAYISDVSTGKANPTGPIDYVRGLSTGRPGGAQK